MLRSSLARLQPASLVVLLLFIVTGPGLAEERTFDYRYDRLGRLVLASDGITQIDYVYDAGGNLLTRTVPEPGLASGLVAGWLALAALRRRRRRCDSSGPRRGAAPPDLHCVRRPGFAARSLPRTGHRQASH